MDGDQHVLIDVDAFERLISNLPLREPEQRYIRAIFHLSQDGKRYGERKGETQKRLAEVCGCDPRHLRRIEERVERYGAVTVLRENGKRSRYRLHPLVIVDRPPLPVQLYKGEELTKRIRPAAQQQRLSFETPSKNTDQPTRGLFSRLWMSVAEAVGIKTADISDEKRGHPADETADIEVREPRAESAEHTPASQTADICDANRGHSAPESADIWTPHGFMVHETSPWPWGHGGFKFVIFQQHDDGCPQWPKSISGRHLREPPAVLELFGISVYWRDVPPNEPERYFATAHRLSKQTNAGRKFTGAVRKRKLGGNEDDWKWAKSAVQQLKGKLPADLVNASAGIGRAVGAEQSAEQKKRDFYRFAQAKVPGAAQEAALREGAGGGDGTPIAGQEIEGELL